MSPLELALYKTRKTALAASREIGIQYLLDMGIELQQCTDCGIWLKPKELIADLDDQAVCQDCVTYYGL